MKRGLLCQRAILGGIFKSYESSHQYFCTELWGGAGRRGINPAGSPSAAHSWKNNSCFLWGCFVFPMEGRVLPRKSREEEAQFGRETWIFNSPDLRPSPHSEHQRGRVTCPRQQSRNNPGQLALAPETRSLCPSRTAGWGGGEEEGLVQCPQSCPTQMRLWLNICCKTLPGMGLFPMSFCFCFFSNTFLCLSSASQNSGGISGLPPGLWPRS